MKDVRRQIILNEDGKLDVELTGIVASLRAVVVVAEKNSNVRNTQMSVEKLAMKPSARCQWYSVRPTCCAW